MLLYLGVMCSDENYAYAVILSLLCTSPKQQIFLTIVGIKSMTLGMSEAIRAVRI